MPIASCQSLLSSEFRYHLHHLLLQPLTSTSLQALSDFADYVQKQQSLRRHPQDNDSAYASASQSAPSTITEDHAELDILDSLGLSDENTHVKLKHLFLDTGKDSDESVALLTGVLNGRLEEGHGECLFDLGIEDSGDSMALTLAEWEAALTRVRTAADGLGADCKLLITKGVGGPEEAEDDAAAPAKKEKGCSGKVILRRRPASVDDVIETRIAVVGNGEFDLLKPHMTQHWS